MNGDENSCPSSCTAWRRSLTSVRIRGANLICPRSSMFAFSVRSSCAPPSMNSNTAFGKFFRARPRRSPTVTARASVMSVTFPGKCILQRTLLECRYWALLRYQRSGWSKLSVRILFNVVPVQASLRIRPSLSEPIGEPVYKMPRVMTPRSCQTSGWQLKMRIWWRVAASFHLPTLQPVASGVWESRQCRRRTYRPARGAGADLPV